MKIRNKRIIKLGIVLALVVILGFTSYNMLMPSNRARFFNANTGRQYKASSLSQSNIHLAIGEEEKTLSLQNYNISIPPATITWTMSDTSIASIVGSSNGKEVKIKGNKRGQTTIFCKDPVEGSRDANVYVVQKIHLNDMGGSGGSSSFNYGPSQGNGYDHYWKDETSSTALTQVNVPTRSGYTFKGYYSQASGGYQITDAQGRITGSAYSFSTLYAQWESNTSSSSSVYTYTLYANGGTGGTSVIYVKDRKAYSNSSCTTEITKINKPTRTGYTFKGYYENTSGIRHSCSNGRWYNKRVFT